LCQLIARTHFEYCSANFLLRHNPLHNTERPSLPALLGM
jgi:hypothetical protein